MAQSSWPIGPARPRLAAETVDVWCVDLAEAGARGDGRALLSSCERERAARYVRAEDGRRWAAARGVLRALLGAYAGADPRALRFEQGAHGKPGLAGGGADGAALRFNLSHSGDLALCAFARGREVGVDVELPRRAVDHVAIARRVLTAAEAERIAAIDDPQARERAFLRAWVRWEAVLKCRGTGIGGAELPPAEPQPWICDLDVGPPGAAALAVEGGPAALRCWRWIAAGR
jgi:4'-phosphopantetheinyl transferase